MNKSLLHLNFVACIEEKSKHSQIKRERDLSNTATAGVTNIYTINSSAKKMNQNKIKAKTSRYNISTVEM